ncbi:hypothetical protein KKD81_00940 [Patescibacteria group bacterium]|nr:hypothetical protein [Patescibacteria group bacterium]
MQKYVVIEKLVGQTPLQAVKLFQNRHPEYSEVPLSYAGRLDPMASGKLLVLIGDECKNQKSYHGLDKEYEIEVLLDIGTDTGDVLGLVTHADIQTESGIADALTQVTGSFEVPYPAFSSKTVDGKPLFLHTLEGNLDSITIPTHTETIFSIKILAKEQVSSSELQKRITNALLLAPTSEEPSKVLGADFRQDAVRESWKRLFSAHPNRTYAVYTLRVACASGTYMRTLAGRIGEALETKACALSIHRTKIGRRSSVLGISVWSRLYR